MTDLLDTRQACEYLGGRLTQWQSAALDEVRQWAEEAAAHADHIEQEFGQLTRDEWARRDAYRAVLNIIARCEAQGDRSRKPISRGQLWKLVNRDKAFPYYKVGGSNKYDRRDLDRYVASRKRGRAA